MKKVPLFTPKWVAFIALSIVTGIFGFSRGSGGNLPPPPLMTLPAAPAYMQCEAPIFGMGRPLSNADLSNVENMGFELREVYFRDALFGESNIPELAYRVEMRMEPKDGHQKSRDPRLKGNHLEPTHTLACNEQYRSLDRGQKATRMTVPVVGDLHLPSGLITVFNQESMDSNLYNHPRISDVTFSNGIYFSFNNQTNYAPTGGPYVQIRTIGQYMNLLRYHYFFNKRVELREMGSGWFGIYAEKEVRGEKAQLMVLLARTN